MDEFVRGPGALSRTWHLVGGFGFASVSVSVLKYQCVGVKNQVL